MNIIGNDRLGGYAIENVKMADVMVYFKVTHIPTNPQPCTTMFLKALQDIPFVLC